ncbi:MAG: TonB-dependent receptor [Gammaproteobacteria bacterium]|nr:TonB-dependent receptor [Gammaproteobacteria bacterium]MBU2057322.1 TonB-dependent receptor [Gammaproteobacteria bacterium]MBU2174924.1 TonB-dependent receptor [Gammaproteobacteria bacterium]MBU2245529.1 TonB-dependent receptor [Gammaproteobacteria bacterium]MBU2344437.1 TonB-dependent receptor [Gammaproteobacteria bacterium]
MTLNYRPNLLAFAVTLACSTLSTSLLADADVEGRITDNRNSLLAGAQVSIPELKLRRTTGADGSFHFRQLAAGTYTLQVNYLGAAPQSQILVVADTQQRLADIKLLSASNSVEHIEVVGQSGAISKALNRQRNANGILTVASTDEMGQFPDSNVSEALQRLAGLSVERDQGEGRFVRVRGLAPDYNAVTYNGTQLAAPEAGRRAVALDVIPSDLLESVEVNKTLTPDMPAGSLGGTVEIKSLSAFDRSHDFYSATVEAGHNELESKTSPKVSAVISRIMDLGGETDVFGVALAASFAERKFGSENVETGGNWDFEEGLEEFELRDYSISRERLGVALNLDYRPGNNNDYYLRTLYSRFSDTEERQGMIVELADPLFAGDTGEAALIRSLKQREETQSISAFVLGTKQTSGDWQWQLEAGASKADEDTPFNISAADFEQEFDQGVGYSGSTMLRLTAPAEAYLAEGYELKEVEMGDTYTKETERNIKFDLSREFTQSQGTMLLKSGAKFSQREKTADEDIWLFEDFEDLGINALSMANYAGGQVDYGLGTMGQAVNSNDIYQLVNSLNRDDFVDDVESQINDYQVDEDISAAYLMAQWERDNWQLITGVRYEHEKRDALGSRYDAINETFSANQVKNSEGYWLPAVVARYNLSEQSIVRAAFSTGLVRPNFEQLSPAFLLEEDDDEVEAAFGNPELEALTSNNFDLGIEHYADQLGVLSAMLFYKQIDNFIYEADLAGRGEYADFAVAETYVNGGKADLYGIELNAVHKVSGFGNWLDNLLLSTNLTLTDSAADIEWFDDGTLFSREVALPSQSDKTANLSLGYETNVISLRLAANYKSDYLAEVGDITDKEHDVHADDHMQVDFTSKWTVQPGMQFYFNVVNLNDEPYYAYTGRKPYNFQYEQYGRTFVLGLQITNW